MSGAAPIRGLVLGGGYSRRFGSAKVSHRPEPSAPTWGESRLALLQNLGLPATLSLRPGQEPGFFLPPGIERIDDAWADAGPMSGLLSAWQCDPGVAWLVVACDLAALDRETLEILLQARNPGALATAFRHPDDGVPEPLCALYEPAAQAPIRVRFAAERRSLRGFLMDALADCRVTLASPPTLAALRSHNEPPPSRGED